MELDKLFYIPVKCWYTLQAWATIAYDEDKNEISGLMTAIPQKDGRYKLSDVEILKQENSGSNTTLDGDAVAAYKMKYAMKHKNKAMKYVWWHSHHTMAAFWSGTDEKEIDAWENESFSLALVINLREEYKFRVSVWKASGLPIEKHFDIPLTIERKSSVNVTDKMKTLYKELCENETHGYGITSNTRQSHFNYNQHFTRVNNSNLIMEDAFSQTIDKLDSINDVFMDGSISVKQYKNELKKINDILKTKNYPFEIDIPKSNKEELLNMIMVTTSGDMINWKDEQTKKQAESYYTWGGVY